MTQRSRFFDSVAGDRVYNADAMAQVVYALMGDGVVASRGFELAVSENSPAAMSVRVNTGSAFVQGRFFEVFGGQEVLAVGAAHATLPRIDRVVVRLDLAARTMVLAVKAGTAAASPTAPSLTQVAGGTWEFSLAQVRVEAAATSIVNAKITDERGARSQGTDIAAILLGSTGHRHTGSDGEGRQVRHTDLDAATVTSDQHHAKSHGHTGADGSGTVAHSATTGRTANDHHNQSHGHTGADGSGTVAHSATTGRTANDHHNENHASRHWYGGADGILVNSLGGVYRNNNQVISGGALYVGFVGDDPVNWYGAGNIIDGDIWIKA